MQSFVSFSSQNVTCENIKASFHHSLQGRLSRNSSIERKPSILKRSPSPRQIHSPSPSLQNQNSRSPSPAFAARTVKHLHSVTEDLTLAESLRAETVEEEPLEEEHKGDHSELTVKNLKYVHISFLFIYYTSVF